MWDVLGTSYLLCEQLMTQPLNVPRDSDRFAIQFKTKVLALRYAISKKMCIK